MEILEKGLDNMSEFFINAKNAREKSIEFYNNNVKIDLEWIFTKIHSAIEKGKREVSFSPNDEWFDWESIEKKLTELGYNVNIIDGYKYIGW